MPRVAATARESPCRRAVDLPGGHTADSAADSRVAWACVSVWVDPSQPIANSDLWTLGYGNEGDYDSGWIRSTPGYYFSRLHMRYTPEQATEDLTLTWSTADGPLAGTETREGDEVSLTLSEPLALGAYTLSLQATDERAASGSDSVGITVVASAPPEITFATPLDQGTYAFSLPIPVSVTVSDPDALSPAVLELSWGGVAAGPGERARTGHRRAPFRPPGPGGVISLEFEGFIPSLAGLPQPREAVADGWSPGVRRLTGATVGRTINQTTNFKHKT